jgi:hypothetical protein
MGEDDRLDEIGMSHAAQELPAKPGWFRAACSS